MKPRPSSREKWTALMSPVVYGCQVSTMKSRLFALKTPELKPVFWRANTQQQWGHRLPALSTVACASVLRSEWILTILTNQRWRIGGCAPPIQYASQGSDTPSRFHSANASMHSAFISYQTQIVSLCDIAEQWSQPIKQLMQRLFEYMHVVRVTKIKPLHQINE